MRARARAKYELAFTLSSYSSIHLIRVMYPMQQFCTLQFAPTYILQNAN